MKNLYLDFNDFENIYPILEALKSYNTLKNNLTFFIKADGLTYPSLDDYKCCVRRNNFSTDDIESIDFYLKPREEITLFKIYDRESTFLRIFDDTKSNRKALYLFLPTSLEVESIKEKIEVAKSFFLKYIGEKDNLKIGYIKKFSLLENKKYREEVMIPHEIELKNALNNDCDIVLLDEESQYYIFNILKNYSKFIKREKDIKSYASKFSPFSYNKVKEREVDVDTILSYSFIEIEKNEKITFSFNKDMSPSDFIDFFKTFEAMK